jgi:hypothetical protein
VPPGSPSHCKSQHATSTAGKIANFLIGLT